MTETTKDPYTIAPQKRFPEEEESTKSVEPSANPKPREFSVAMKIDRSVKEKKQVKTMAPIFNPKKNAKKNELNTPILSSDPLTKTTSEVDKTETITKANTIKTISFFLVLLLWIVIAWKYQGLINTLVIINPFTTSTTTQGPIITFVEKDFDFGSIPQTTIVEHAFLFTNTGATDLEIKKIVASCSCIAGTPMKDGKETRIIKAGETSEILVKFNPKDRFGQQKRIITVFTNDPNLEQTRLFVSAVVTGSNSSQNEPG